MSKLKPCRCGCVDGLIVWQIISQTCCNYYVDCGHCGETTSTYKTELEAIEAWNERVDNAV